MLERSVDVKESYYAYSIKSLSGQQPDKLITHDEIPFFDVIDYGLQKGFRLFFRRMPTQLSD